MAKLGPKICGFKLSACCTVFGLWGVIQLVILGFCFGIKSIPLFPSVSHLVHHVTTKTAVHEYNQMYDELSVICYQASIVSLITFLISIWQLVKNISVKPRRKKQKFKDDKRLDNKLTYREVMYPDFVPIQERKPPPESQLKYIHIEK